MAESSTNLRDSTKTTSTSLGLVRLLLERGISASVYNPLSWDRGLDASGASTPVGGAQTPRCTDKSGDTDDRWPRKRPDSLLLQPSTPTHSPLSKSDSATNTCPVFQFSPAADDPPYYDTFLASKPARIILREVLGEAERERGGQTDDEDDSQAEMLNLRLVDKLKRFHTLLPLSASVSTGRTMLAPFGSNGMVNSALSGGLSGLNAGLRRNRSYPAMVGASMAMKDPGGPPSTEIIIPHAMQTPNTQNRKMSKKQTNHTLVTKDIHMPQTLHAPETVTPQTIIQRHTRLNDELQDSPSKDRHSDDATGT